MLHILDALYPLFLSGGITVLAVVDVVSNIRSPRPTIRTDLFARRASKQEF